MNLWDQSLPLFRESLGETAYLRWVAPIAFDRQEGSRLFLRVPSRFVRDYLHDEGLADQIRQTLQRHYEERYELVFEIDPQVRSAQPAPAPEKSGESAPVAKPSEPEVPPSVVVRPQVRGNPLNNRYVFNSFVVGKSNEFAYAACRAVASNPTRNDYNPLFIFGGVGLGKTHLVNAIGHAILDRNPKTRIIYTSSENFTNEVIAALQQGRMNELKKKYRTECDVLLIDDIQFIAGKQATQEEFFHTFEELHHHGKQIVVTSDKPARDIEGLEERLRSRLDWGLAVDIAPPEFETKLAILKRKAETLGFKLNDDVANFLATYCGANMRELEGSLNRVVAFYELNGRPPDLERVQSLFQHAIEERSRKPSVEVIQKLVAEKYGVKISDLKSARKLKVVAQPRQVAMYLARKWTDASFPEIGEKFGGRDHSTVIYACKRVEESIQQDFQLRQLIQGLERNLGLGNGG